MFGNSTAKSTTKDQPAPKSQYVPPIYTVPKDSEGYMQSFSLNQEAEIHEFFTQFGFVIVRDVFSKETCEATINEMWANLADKYEIARDDPDTWQNNTWRHTGIFSEGILGGNPFWTHQALTNRQNPNLHKAFSIVLGTEDLLVNHDRFGLFRPTRQVFHPKSGKTVDHPDWKTMRNVHLDMNPWSYIEQEKPDQDDQILSKLTYKAQMEFIIENNHIGVYNPAFRRLSVQGLVNLADNREEDGGFHIVPGFYHHIKEWAENSTHLRRIFGPYETFVVIPEEEPVTKHAVRVTCRAGSAVIWNQATLHGSTPNNSSKPRYAQFFKMFPKLPADSARAKNRSLSVKKRLDEVGFVPSELGKKVFGLDILA